MPEIGTSGLMSGERKRSVAAWPKLPRLSSTLLRLRSLSYGGQVAHPGYACCSHTRRFQPSGLQPRLFGAIEKGDDYGSSAVLKPPPDHLG